MGKKSSERKRLIERKALIERVREQNAPAIKAWELYATNPVYKHLVDAARASKYERENRPVTRAIQRAHAIAKFKEQGINIEGLGIPNADY